MRNHWLVSVTLVLALLLAACSTTKQRTTPGPTRQHDRNGSTKVRTNEGGLRLLVYKVEDLLGGRVNPHRETPLPPLSQTLATSFNSNGSDLMLFPTIQDQRSDIYTVGIDGSSIARIPGPLNAGGGFALGGWLPDGNMFLVGHKVWVRDDKGAGWVEQADVGLTWVAVPSPDYTQLALWGPNPEGNYTIYDVTTRSVQRKKGLFRRCAEDGGINLAWSPDGKFLAGTDCDSDATGEGLRIRIVDPSNTKDVTTVEGFGLISWLPTAKFLAMRTRPELVLLDKNGTEERTLSGYGHPSPSGKFILQWVYEKDKESVYLVNVENGKRHELDLPGRPRWTNVDEIIVIN